VAKKIHEMAKKTSKPSFCASLGKKREKDKL
jgi:hypothetical protein